MAEKGVKVLLTAKEIPGWMARKFEENTFMKLADVKLEKVECGYCELSMDADPEHKHGNRYGVIHGGALFTLADTAMGAVGYSIGCKVVTLYSSINFLSNTSAKEKVWAKASLIHAGRSTVVTRVMIYDHTGKEMADVTGTMFVIGHFDEIPKKW